MISLDMWQLVLTIISTLTVGGVISSVIALKWSKRTNEANTQKLEEEVEQAAAKSDQERKTTDSIAIQNAKEVINMYKESVKELTELYNQKTNELADRCNRLENDFNQYRQNARKRLADLEASVNELQVSLKMQCDNCSFKDECKKRTSLGIKSRRVKSQKSKNHE